MRSVHLNKRVPGSRLGAAGGPQQDDDISEIQEWLQQQGLPLIGQTTVQQAVNLVAREHAFHPVRDYLNGLVWDGVPRLDTWMRNYLGCNQSNQYLKVIGRCFILSMVYRVMQPGCQCDYMIVLEGDQGALKTSACRVLAGEWFSNSLPDLHGFDEVRLSMHLRGKWLIEIGELASFRRSDMDKLKNFLTRRDENFTAKFARNEVTEPRQCVFMGTTNERDYLKDATGARRQWPVEVGSIRLDLLRANRDQLFAEAMVGYRKEEQYWPDRVFEDTHIKPEQDSRREPDPWEHDVAAWVRNPKGDMLDQEPPALTTRNIAFFAVKLTISRFDTVSQKRIAVIMRRLGWQQRVSTREWYKPIKNEHVN